MSNEALVENIQFERERENYQKPIWSFPNTPTRGEREGEVQHEKYQTGFRSEWILIHVTFCTLRQYRDEAWSRDRDLLIFRMTSRVLYSAQYHRRYCTLHAFGQFGALYMHNHDDKYTADREMNLVPPVDTNEPSGPARFLKFALLMSRSSIGVSNRDFVLTSNKLNE